MYIISRFVFALGLLSLSPAYAEPTLEETLSFINSYARMGDRVIVDGPSGDCVVTFSHRIVFNERITLPNDQIIRAGGINLATLKISLGNPYATVRMYCAERGCITAQSTGDDGSAWIWVENGMAERMKNAVVFLLQYCGSTAKNEPF